MFIIVSSSIDKVALQLLRVETASYGNKILADKVYDKFGRLIETTDNYFDGQLSQANSSIYAYDNLSRINHITYQGNITDYSYGISSNKYFETTTIGSNDYVSRYLFIF